MTRRKILAGNWKMHKTRNEASAFFDLFTKQVSDLSRVTRAIDIAFGVPATLFDVCVQKVAGTGVKILAQNVHYEKQGAFTGELSCAMLQDASLQGSLIGHSERRQYFAETDVAVGKKWNSLALSGLLPVICVGETKSEREANQTDQVLKKQIETALLEVSADARTKEFVIAYEPVWAIGTGLTASPAMANEAHKYIRELLGLHFGKERAEAVRILYGGSMNPSNCAELLREQHIDGGLIGGASLKVDDFVKMIQSSQV